ncbi:MAG: polymerase sigma factor SigL [Mycobacterium sp.]|nr:polymerase sigma factor SigL [Mycobacterium sp.]
MGVSGDDTGALVAQLLNESRLGPAIEGAPSGVHHNDYRPASGQRSDQHLAAEDPKAAVVRSLYDGHAAPLWRYALRLTGDQARAEDVVQETLLRAWQHPEVVDDGERSARAWLFTVARNMIIDERRTARFRNEVSSLDSVGFPEPSTPDQVNAALDRLLLGEALIQLSAEHRAVIHISYYQGRTTAQIADDLEIAEGTVKSRLHYAVRALRLTLQEMGVTR